MHLVRAYSKINLFLDIVGKRPDGYHDIKTIFQSVDLYDVLKFKESDKTSFTISDKTIPLDKTNTVCKAVALFSERIKERNGKVQNFEISIEKKTPAGAGMGGGSSDGAAALRFLNYYHSNPFAENELEEMALKIGADTVFLLKGGLAIGENLGEKLEYFDYPQTEDLFLAVVYPNVHISTKWAYDNCSKYLTNDKKYYNINSLKKDFNEFIGSLKFSYNVFEELVYKNYPRLKDIKNKLESKRPILSMMTGSGSAIYALFDNSEVFESIKKEFGGNNLIFTTPITQQRISDQFLTKL
ncbi:MAG: 4-(cytidine 5'-diphospho)-2-C-methyl-D-erythritol kinase [bacterium]|nr:4-(cytidine 5'-diphospho)-2-C-methyl-D-erythritol kinase [bacterium]